MVKYIFLGLLGSALIVSYINLGVVIDYLHRIRPDIENMYQEKTATDKEYFHQLEMLKNRIIVLEDKIKEVRNGI